MRKIISCKIIRSIPLNMSSDELHHTSRSNTKSHKISDASKIPNIKKHLWEPETTTHSKLVTYTDRLDITRMSINDDLTAQVLDIYV